MRCEGRLTEEFGPEWRTISGDRGGTVDPATAEVQRGEARAVPRSVVFALGAYAAAIEGQDHLVTRCDLGDRVTDCCHGATALVSQDRGERERQMAVSDSQVGVTQPHSCDRHDDLVGGGFCQLYRLDREVGTDFGNDCCCDVHEVKTFRATLMVWLVSCCCLEP